MVARIVNTPNFPVRDALRMRLWMTPLDLSPARDVYGGLFFPERFCGDVTLSQFLELTFRQPPYPVVSQPSILEYDIIDPSIGDISQKIIFSVSYVDRSLRRVGTYDIVVPSDGTVLTLICEFLCCVNVEEGGTGLLRAIEFKKMRDIRSLRPNDLLSSISELSQLYIEELPQDELLIPTSRDLCVAKDSILGDQKQFDAAMHERKVMRALPPETYDIPSNIDCGNYEFSDPNTSGAFTINCLSFSRELSRPNGIPFRFVVIPGEPFSDTKKRLRARMGVEKYFSKIQYIITSPSYNNAVVLQDDMVLSDFQWTGGELLECDHFGKSNRVTRYTSEKPVRIHG